MCFKNFWQLLPSLFLLRYTVGVFGSLKSIPRNPDFHCRICENSKHPLVYSLCVTKVTIFFFSRLYSLRYCSCHAYSYQYFFITFFFVFCRFFFLSSLFRSIYVKLSAKQRSLKLDGSTGFIYVKCIFSLHEVAMLLQIQTFQRRKFITI